jgi:hypothetical protein
MYALKQMMKEISFTRKNYKLTATKRMNTPDREHPPEHPEEPVFIKSCTPPEPTLADHPPVQQETRQFL